MNVTAKPCQNFLNKMANIVFSDFRFIYKFAETCRDDIDELGCGRISLNADDEVNLIYIHIAILTHKTVKQNGEGLILVRVINLVISIFNIACMHVCRTEN